MTNASAFPAARRAAALFLAILCLSSMPARSQEAERLAQATRLIERGQLQEMSALGMRMSVRRAVLDGKATQAFLDCVSRADAAVFTPLIAAHYADLFSTAQLSEAVRFFESPAGKKYVEYTFSGFETAVGAPAPRPMPVVTMNEQKEMEAFVATPLGRYMTAQDAATAAATQKTAAKAIGPIVEKCRSATGTPGKSGGN